MPGLSRLNRPRPHRRRLGHSPGVAVSLLWGLILIVLTVLPVASAQTLPGLGLPAAPGSNAATPGTPGTPATPATPAMPVDVVVAEAFWIPPERFPAGGAGAGQRYRLLAVLIDVAEGFHINPAAHQIPESMSFLIPTELTVAQAPAGWRARATAFPDPTTLDVAYTGEPTAVPVFEGNVILLLMFQVDEQAEPGPVTVDLRYQACDDRRCLRPRTLTLTAYPEDVAPVREGSPLDEALGNFDFTALPRGTVPMGLTPVERDDHRADSPVDSPAAAPTPGGGLLLVGYVLLAIIGGFLLNLTPCVLPVIPLKIMGLSRAAASRGRCMALGVAMAAGVIAFWMGLAAAITLVTGFTATNQLFQYPLFTIGVGLVIAAMAVGMCGLFAIQLPQWVYRINPGHDTLVGSFGFGVMTAVLSTPCTAPVMGAALAWSATQHPAATLTVFAALGLGMALPYLVLAAWPSLVEKVPRTGPGSELLKQVMGLLMLAAAAFFIGTGVSGLLAEPGSAPTRAYWWAVSACIMGAGLWLAWRTWRITNHSKPRAVFGMLGGIAVVAAIVMGLRLTAPGPVQWQYYTPQRFAAARAEGKVIVLEFTAEWCLNCKALEQTVLHDDGVAAALRASDVAAIKVDLTGDNPEGNAKLAEAGRLTIPLLVIYDRDGQAIFTRDFYTASQVLAAIQQARGG